MTIYRYIPLKREYLEAVCKHQLWMSLPTSFNDPFDCDHDVQTDGTSHEERLRLIEKIIGHDVDNDLRNHPDPKITEQLLKDYAADEFKKKMKSVGVCCFSRRWKSVAMWSHYADKHQGICLGYEKDSLTEKTGYLYDDVHYQKDPPDVHIRDIVDDFGGTMSRYLFTKKKVWEYEKEWRLVHLSGDDSTEWPFVGWLVDSPMPLRSVTFGFRAQLELIKKTCCALRSREIKFYKIERKPGTFKLKREPVTF